jgi:hypothetical protein
MADDSWARGSDMNDMAFTGDACREKKRRCRLHNSMGQLDGMSGSFNSRRDGASRELQTV